MSSSKMIMDFVDLLLRLPLENCTIEYADGRIEENAKVLHSVGGGWSTPSIVIEHKREKGAYSASHYEYQEYGAKFHVIAAD